METQMLNIIKQYKKKNSKHLGAVCYRKLPCYYYKIQGIGIMLYDDPEEHEGLYSTAEYFTGRHCRSAPTMQEALDAVTKMIEEVGYAAIQKRIAKHLADTGYANPMCSLCGIPHPGGLENCKE